MVCDKVVNSLVLRLAGSFAESGQFGSYPLNPFCEAQFNIIFVFMLHMKQLTQVVTFLICS